MGFAVMLADELLSPGHFKPIIDRLFYALKCPTGGAYKGNTFFLSDVDLPIFSTLLLPYCYRW
jgi:hypothetical protein